MGSSDFPAPETGILATHFIIAADVAKSVAFYSEVLGGSVAYPGPPGVVKLANTWIIINEGGGPTPDKPTVVLETPPDPDRASAFMNLRVADIQDVYKTWSARGAEFITEPLDNNGFEMRCYMRDPDGHIIEVGQATGILDMLS